MEKNIEVLIEKEKGRKKWYGGCKVIYGMIIIHAQCASAEILLKIFYVRRKLTKV